MGKKSLLAPTSGENTDSGEGPEKGKKPLKASGPSKKATPKSAKKKPAATKKRSAGSKTAKKKAAPKNASRKKKAPSGKPTAAKSSVKPKAKKGAPAGKKTAAKKKPAVKKKPAIEAPSKPLEKTAFQVSGKEEARQELPAFVAPEEKEKTDPMRKMAAVGIAVLVVLLVMVIGSSASNVGKFFLVPVDGGLEVWKGRFSPKGLDKIYTLQNVATPIESKTACSMEEAHALVFEGIIADADALLGTEEIPDFERIRYVLESARPFAVSKEMTRRLQIRLDKIDMMAFAYRADVLAGKGTVSDLTRARESLERAMRLNLDEAERGLIQQKIDWVDQKLSEAAE